MMLLLTSILSIYMVEFWSPKSRDMIIDMYSTKCIHKTKDVYKCINCLDLGKRNKNHFRSLLWVLGDDIYKKIFLTPSLKDEKITSDSELVRKNV